MRSVLQYYGIDKDEREKQVQLLRTIKEKYAHLMLNVRTHNIKMTRLGEPTPFERRQLQQEKTNKLDAAKASASKFLKFLPQHELAFTLFELLLNHLPKDRLNIDDLTVAVTNRRGQRQVVTLVDYLSALTTPRAEYKKTKTHKLLKRFHSYMTGRRRLKLPSTFIRNKEFK